MVGLIDMHMDLRTEGEVAFPRKVGDPRTIEIEVPEAVIPADRLEPIVAEGDIDEVERPEGGKLEKRHSQCPPGVFLEERRAPQAEAFEPG